MPFDIWNKLLSKEEKFINGDKNPKAFIFYPRLENNDVFVISTSGSFKSKFLKPFKSRIT